MRLQRFYIKTPIVLNNNSFDVADKDLIHQWKKVFRYNVGSQVIIFDGSGVDFLCMISSLRSLGATLSVIQKINTSPESPRRNIVLGVALIKKDNFELVVQKATELGVSRVIPLLCEHSEKKKINMERMEKISIEASEQSGRGDILSVSPTVTLQELFQRGDLPQDKVVFDPRGAIDFQAYNAAVKAPSLVAFVGPEGGFSEKEIEFFKSYNVPIVSLGKQILRAETAAIAVSSLLIL